MAIAHIRTLVCRRAALRALASMTIMLATVMGRVVDEGSRLPLGGVRVHADGPTRADAVTDKQGNFSLNKLKPGKYVVTTESPNVPAQVFLVNVHEGGIPQAHFLRVCSNDDEHCGPPTLGGGHP